MHHQAIQECDLLLHEVGVPSKLKPNPKPNPKPSPSPNPNPNANPNPQPNPDPDPDPTPNPNPNPTPSPTQAGMPPTHTPAAALKQLPDSIKLNLKLIHVGMRSFDANFKPFGFERVKVEHTVLRAHRGLLTRTRTRTRTPDPNPGPEPRTRWALSTPWSCLSSPARTHAQRARCRSS